MQSRKDAAPRRNVSLEYIQITSGGVSSPIRRGGRNYFSGSIISNYEFHLPFRWIDPLAVDIPLHSYPFPFFIHLLHSPIYLFLASFDGICPSSFLPFCALPVSTFSTSFPPSFIPLLFPFPSTFALSHLIIPSSWCNRVIKHRARQVLLKRQHKLRTQTMMMKDGVRSGGCNFSRVPSDYTDGYFVPFSRRMEARMRLFALIRYSPCVGILKIILGRNFTLPVSRQLAEKQSLEFESTFVNREPKIVWTIRRRNAHLFCRTQGPVQMRLVRRICFPAFAIANSYIVTNISRRKSRNFIEPIVQLLSHAENAVTRRAHRSTRGRIVYLYFVDDASSRWIHSDECTVQHKKKRNATGIIFVFPRHRNGKCFFFFLFGE